MNNKIYFTPGPSELYPTVAHHIQTALVNKIASISHRSQQFKDIYAHAVAGLRELLHLPSDYEILFLSSANEIWERAIQNLVAHEAFHLVNGSFSKRFYQVTNELGRKAIKHEVPFGEGFQVNEINIPDSAELIALIQNETSSGASMSVEEINLFRSKVNEDALIFVDGVSALPVPALDYSLVDSVYFSVQKCFGLPAGLGIWLLNKRCITKAEALQEKGISLGSYHSLPGMLSKAATNQTVETPNVLSIYLLSKVVEDMLEKGISTIRVETAAKALLIYNYLDESKNFSIAVQEPTHRSATTIVANTDLPASEINTLLAPYDMAIGSGYGDHKEKQVRIANFPAHSVEQVEALVTKLKELVG